jgi:predicted nucleic acid-binding Zn ribbon protein
MSPPSPAPLAVRALLERCLDRVAGEPGAAAIWRVWADAVGPQIARRAQPIRLRGRTLLVAVASAPWMQELQLLKRSVQAELNARLPAPIVDDLFFVLTATAAAGDDLAAAGDAPARTVRRACPPPPATCDLTDLPDALRASLGGIARAWQRRSRP